MKKLKYLLFLSIIFLAPSVFAIEYDVTSSITSPQGQGRTGTYTGLEIYNSGSNNVYNVNTRYNGQLSQIVYNIPLPSNWEDGSCFSTNVDYTVTMYMATDDWRNNFSTVIVKNSLSPSSNWSNGNVIFVSMKKIYFNFKIPTSESGSCYDSFLVTLKSNNISTQAFTGVSNWNLSKVTITDPTISSSGGSSGGGSSGSTNQDIINNNNTNTQDIINNNNTNTQDIINNNNSNSQQIITNQNDNTDKIIESNENLLGQCDRNIFSDSKVVGLGNLQFSNGKYVQINADGFSNPNLKLAYMYNGDFVAENSYTPTISINRFKWTFTKSSNFNQLRFGVNGATVDSVLLYDVSNLTNGQEYSLIYNIDNATQGYISISNIMIIKGNANPTSYIPQGQSQCVSKLDDLKNQQNQNTQDIINNQNSNAQATQDTINENFNNCRIIHGKNLWGGFTFSRSTYGVSFTYNQDGTITATGTATDAALSMLLSQSSDYLIHLDPGTYTLSGGVNASQRVQLISSTGVEIASSGSTSSTFTLIAGTDVYVRLRIAFGQTVDNTFYIQLEKGNSATSFEPFTSTEKCTNRIDDLNDSITNSNVDSDTGSDFFDGFTSEDFGLSQIITIPLNTIESLTSKTCVPLQLPIPFTNSNITLPCMTEVYEERLPSIYNLWKIVSFGIVAYLISIDIFHIVKGFKDPESDKVEVLDL